MAGQAAPCGAELYLELNVTDRRMVDMMVNCGFGGNVTLPSGRVLSAEQMASIAKHD